MYLPVKHKKLPVTNVGPMCWLPGETADFPQFLEHVIWWSKPLTVHIRQHIELNTVWKYVQWASQA